MAVVPASLDPAGPAAEDIATLWWVLLAVGTVVFGVVLVALVVPMLRRRWRGGGDESADRSEVPAATSTRWIVGLGVVLTTILLVGVLVVTVATVRSISRAAPAEATRIDVVGYQYWWAATYPNHGVTVANELHVPVDEPVELHLTSADVIHSFWAPELHGKLDLLPDGTNRLVIEADEPGVYGGECAEFCGIQHANMGFLVVAQPRAEFEAWVAAQQRPAAEPATAAGTRGREVFVDEGCGSCHVIAGVSTGGEDVGPDLTHVGSRSTLASDTIANTPEDLSAWLRDPGAVKAGTTMPDPELTDEQVSDLVAYLDALT